MPLYVQGPTSRLVKGRQGTMRPTRVSERTDLALVREWKSLPTFSSCSDGSASAAADIQPQASASFTSADCVLYGNACCTCTLLGLLPGRLGRCESASSICGRCMGWTPQQLPARSHHHVQVRYVPLLLYLLYPQTCGQCAMLSSRVFGSTTMHGHAIDGMLLCSAVLHVE